MEKNKEDTNLAGKMKEVDAEKNSLDDAFMLELKCETCMYSEHCDGWEYAPFCIAEL